MEDGVAILVADEELVLVQVSPAVGITQFPQAKEIVCDAGHDVARTSVLSGDGRYAQLGGCRRELRFTRCGANGGARC